MEAATGHTFSYSAMFFSSDSDDMRLEVMGGASTRRLGASDDDIPWDGFPHFMEQQGLPGDAGVNPRLIYSPRSTLPSPSSYIFKEDDLFTGTTTSSLETQYAESCLEVMGGAWTRRLGASGDDISLDGLPLFMEQQGLPGDAEVHTWLNYCPRTTLPSPSSYIFREDDLFTGMTTSSLETQYAESATTPAAVATATSTSFAAPGEPAGSGKVCQDSSDHPTGWGDKDGAVDEPSEPDVVQTEPDGEPQSSQQSDAFVGEPATAGVASPASKELIQVYICGYPHPDDNSKCCAMWSYHPEDLDRHRGTVHLGQEQRLSKQKPGSKLVFGGTIGPFMGCDLNPRCPNKFFNRKISWKRHVHSGFCNGKGGRTSKAKDDEIVWVTTPSPLPKDVIVTLEYEHRYPRVEKIHKVIESYQEKYLLKSGTKSSEASIRFLSIDDEGGVAFYTAIPTAVAWFSWRAELNGEKPPKKNNKRKRDEDEEGSPGAKGKGRQLPKRDCSSRMATRRA